MHKKLQRWSSIKLLYHYFHDLSKNKFKIWYDLIWWIMISFEYGTISICIIIIAAQSAIKLHKNWTKNMGWMKPTKYSNNLFGKMNRNFLFRKSFCEIVTLAQLFYNRLELNIFNDVFYGLRALRWRVLSAFIDPIQNALEVFCEWN